jgi:serine/threonine protein kinase
LERINLGLYGKSQIGKFITIYPKKEYLIQTLEILHYYFHNFTSIPIPSDYCYKLSGCIYYRFGTIIKDILNIDKRDKKINPGIQAYEIPDFQTKVYRNIPKKYIIIKVLKKLGYSGVLLALDLKKHQKVIIRYNRKNYDLDSSNIDGKDRLLNSKDILQRLSKYKEFEKVQDSFYIDDYFFLITNYIEGKTLDYLATHGLIDSFSYDDKMLLLKKITNAVLKMHKENIVFRDLSFGNVIIDKSYNVHFIDFEYSVSIDNLNNYGGIELENAGTYGFYNEKNNIISDDIDFYSISQVLYYLFVPSDYRQYVLNTSINTTYNEIQELINKKDVSKLNKDILKIYEDIKKGNSPVF